MGVAIKTIIYNGWFELPDKDAASQRMFANAKILKKIGYRVIVVGITEKPIKEKYLFKNYKGFECYIVRSPKNEAEKLLSQNNFNMCRTIIENERVDAIISYNYPSLAFMRLNRFCHSRGIKTIVDITEWYDGRGNPIHKLAQNVEISLRMKFAYYKADALIVISKYLQNYYSHKMKCLYIPSLVDKENDKWKVTNQEYENDGSCTLIYAGFPSATKESLDIIIELLGDLYKRNKDIKFKFEIVGITEREYNNIYDKQIPGNINKFITFYGKIEHQEVIKKVAKSNFSLIVRKKCRVNNAGFPTKLAESFACGTPVIATEISNIKDYINEGINGFIININDYNAALDKLNLILSQDSEKYTYMKEKATEYSELDINSYLTETSRFFTNI